MVLASYMHVSHLNSITNKLWLPYLYYRMCPFQHAFIHAFDIAAYGVRATCWIDRQV